ncbi:MAG: hypothetical protein LBT14_07305 [Treponema sp.]|nr:hypothetical protein [Treponema sp.]
MMRLNRLSVSCMVLGVVLSMPLCAQDDGFGFGFDDTPDGGGNETAGSASSGITISGEAKGKLQGFINDFDDADSLKLGNIFLGKLNFAANASYGGAIINLRLAPSLEYYDGKSPVYVDEAYAQGNFGSVNVEAGLRKLTWGKADSYGPLDVINPIDYSDASTLANTGDVKIPRPMVHAAFHVGDFSKLEAVFVPNFQGNRYEMRYDNRWAISQVKTLPDMVAKGIAGQFPSPLPPAVIAGYSNQMETILRKSDLSAYLPDTTSIRYAQGGLRFTTTTGPADWGLQYYYGRLARPSLNGITPTYTISDPLNPATLTLTGLRMNAAYNPYHHIGADYAQVIGGFNVRAEFSANITDDLAGDDGAVYNPFLAWSLGFDRSLFWNIKLNLQANEKVRLMHGNIGNNPALDTEAGTDTTSTRITAVLSRVFLQDKLECKLTALWDIEDRGCYVIPALRWKQDDISFELAGGIFTGDDRGELGQYHDNGFLRLQMTYSF